MLQKQSILLEDPADGEIQGIKKVRTRNRKE